MKIVFFGGSGFLGSHVCDKLSDAGHDVTIVDLRPSPYLRPDQKMVTGSLLDEDLVNTVVSGADAVFDFAGLADIGESNQKPVETARINVLGNVILLEACRKAGVKRYVFASTLYVYGKSGGFYRCSKQACELYIENYHDMFGLEYTILRYGSLYGPRADRRNAINRFVAEALEKGTITYYGAPTALREYIHVEDAALSTAEILGINNMAVFATASLRNISNTKEALAAIKEATGYAVDLISGREEALYGYAGAMVELGLSRGAFVDIGGASTEIASFSPGEPVSGLSFGIGSLSLYRDCVKKILPGHDALKKLRRVIETEIDSQSLFELLPRTPLACVGGTSRAVLKLAGKLYSLPPDCRRVTAEQLSGLCALLCKGDRAALDLILKLEPDRIHTIVPGILILQHICGLFGAKEIVVSKYGVREGYLCAKVLGNNMPTPKTES